ncbi:hypothetical protein CFAM422_009184 [Trichoderma lentiforme]|uniref:Secreted protein n=1 Tax=Trichoderma lentiforme TaxID=1567552 RepID=A0A9P4XA37_9HYPO|nr:hypothetical protein CFAM422_009184 [Trichoderma lentiforme]
MLALMLMLMLYVEAGGDAGVGGETADEREGQWAVGDIAAGGATCQVKCVDAVLLRYNEDALDLDIHWASAWAP